MLELTVISIDGGNVTFTITKQDGDDYHRAGLKDIATHRILGFRASNGMFIKSNYRPDASDVYDENTLWIRGTEGHRDQQRMQLPMHEFDRVYIAVNDFGGTVVYASPTIIFND